MRKNIPEPLRVPFKIIICKIDIIIIAKDNCKILID